jgi:hypothetical protein
MAILIRRIVRRFLRQLPYTSFLVAILFAVPIDVVARQNQVHQNKKNAISLYTGAEVYPGDGTWLGQQQSVYQEWTTKHWRWKNFENWLESNPKILSKRPPRAVRRDQSDYFMAYIESASAAHSCYQEYVETNDYIAQHKTGVLEAAFSQARQCARSHVQESLTELNRRRKILTWLDGHDAVQRHDERLKSDKGVNVAELVSKTGKN